MSLAAVPAPDGSWRTRAACSTVPTAVFFAADELSERIALGMCRGCLARGECLAEAMADEGAGTFRFGVRGATTPAQRRALYAARRAEPVVVAVHPRAEPLREPQVVRRHRSGWAAAGW